MTTSQIKETSESFNSETRKLCATNQDMQNYIDSCNKERSGYTEQNNLAKCRVSLARKWPNVTSGPLCDLRSSTLAQTNGINVLSKNLRGNSFLVRVGGRYLKKTSPILTKLSKYLLSSVCYRPLLDLRSSTLAQMNGINVLIKNLRGNNFLVRVRGRNLKKTSPILTKLAKYLLSSVSSRPLLDLRRSTVAQMKGINVLSKNLRGNNVLVRVGGRYLKKTSPILTKLARYLLSGVR